MNEDYFLAGGNRISDGKCIRNLWRITFRVEIFELVPMPNKKELFPLIFFKMNRTLITLGGGDGKALLKEVT